MNSPQPNFERPHAGLPAAPQVNLPPDPGAQPVDAELKRVIMLLFVNLGLSIILTVLVFILRDQIVNYQLAHIPQLRNIDPAETDTIRQTLRTSVWIRVGSVLIVSLVYLLIAFKLRQGKRWAYRRVLWISIAGLIGILYLIFLGNYPIWMRIEQGLQAIILIALFYAVTRPAVRARFAKPVYP